ncbi:MAG: SpoIIE family protein phosphatase [Herpetosiphonaceae bacterium]|nr:SpoIIE family protein phosphatase [Herpetosiphonaceae bacterium]
MTVSVPPPDSQARTLDQQLAYAQRNLSTLLTVARAGRGATEPMIVLETIYAQLAQLLPVDAFSVAVCTNEQPDTYHTMLFIDEGVHYEETDPRTGGLTGYIIKHLQPLLFRDLQADYPPGLPRPQAFGNLGKRSHSWIGVPLLAGHTAIGAMTVQSYRLGVYSEADLELVVALADLAAVAIDNALLYEHQVELTRSLAERVTARQEELAVLSGLAAGLSRGQPSAAVLDEALERVLWLLGVNAGAIWLHRPHGAWSRIAWRATGAAPETAEWLDPQGDSLEAQVIASGTLLQQFTPPDHWLCAVPLQAQGGHVGVMTLWGQRELQPTETSLLLAAGDQLGLGIENSRLLEERDRQIAQLEALGQVAEASAATRDLRSMLRQVCETLQEFLHLDGFLAALYNPGTHTLSEGVGWHVAGDMQLIDVPVPPGHRIAQLLTAREPLSMAVPAPHPTDEWWEQGAAAWLGVPMLDHLDVAVGVIAIQSTKGAAFDRRDVQFMTNVAHQITLNVLNAQLYRNVWSAARIAERRADNLALVHTISRLVSSSLDPVEVLRIASEQLAQLFGVDHCAVNLFSEDDTSSEIVAEYPVLGTLHQRFTFRSSASMEETAGLGQPLFITDIAHDRRIASVRELALRLGVQALLVIPLVRRGRAYGAFGLSMLKQVRHFGEEDFELCRTIAAQVTTALENARLHQMAVTRVEQEMEIARSIQANLFPRTLPLIPGVGLAARCIPAFETGGDFYDVLPLGNDRFGFSIGDVSGKSLSAAMLMAVARSIVRSEAIDHAAPDVVMAETNKLIAQDIPPRTFVALCYAVYDARTRELIVANAGQITPLLRHPDGSVDWLPVRPNLPLGIMPDLHYYATTVQLLPGDTVLFLTDGLVEAFSPSREMFGFERVQALLRANGNLPPTQLMTTLLDQVCDWQGNQNRHDDMTVIVAQIE